ncbi:unnamed protein product [Lepeophtheirus salmonis]|uniref:(salmon louse) hypothetical protein n=1 Tax=Lepeophtheirus salmonis TaxID=72036 RepID=A0A7R8H2H5_LEPSM|nr:unnamed protein product [Lepeophtheirus salmonis]CAF2814812.1 unnamed protein product [Lepeophtheirus salmonis]
MAWGFWTTYNVHVESRRSRQFTNPAVIRERSWERLEMRTYGKIEQASSDRIAYERHLLLGDRDWSEKTVADRNTLPRKKNPSDFEKTSTPSPPPFNISTIDNSVFKGGEDSESKKSEDLFCPACHRESRVSFGSITSSRESSHGRTKSEDDSIIASVNNNANSEVKLDEVAQGLHSSSLPTPPPPPPIFTPHPINAFNLKTTNSINI